MLEMNAKAAKQLQENSNTLKANAQIKQTDALTWLAHTDEKFDLIFLDPPFNKGLLPKCIELIESRQLLNTNGWIYIESEQDLGVLNLPKSWHLHRDKKAGKVVLRLFQQQG